MPHVSSFLDISTGHIQEKDLTLLEAGEYPTHTASYDYGVYVSVPSEPLNDAWIAKELQSRGYSAALGDVLTLAQELNCTLIRIDRDGLFTDQLPTYDW